MIINLTVGIINAFDGEESLYYHKNRENGVQDDYDVLPNYPLWLAGQDSYCLSLNNTSVRMSSNINIRTSYSS